MLQPHHARHLPGPVEAISLEESACVVDTGEDGPWWQECSFENQGRKGKASNGPRGVGYAGPDLHVFLGSSGAGVCGFTWGT